MLSTDEIARFREQGYVVARGVASSAALVDLRADLDGWIEDSRVHDANYGETIDGKKRFDLEQGHSAQAPQLRRVANPADVSEAYRRFLFDGPVPDLVAQLFGPAIKFHHCKINIKLPGMTTRVDWHQDHAFDPHTNEDMLTALILLDDMTEENGCLLVVPGSQRERYSHYQDGKFVGATAPDLEAGFDRQAVPVTGKAGDVCLLHCWSLHASGANHSSESRRLLICDYSAADAFPLTSPILPSPLSGTVVRGEPSLVARLQAERIELPPRYEEDSFFGVQTKKAAGRPQS